MIIRYGTNRLEKANQKSEQALIRMVTVAPGIAWIYRCDGKRVLNGKSRNRSIPERKTQMINEIQAQSSPNNRNGIGEIMIMLHDAIADSAKI